MRENLGDCEFCFPSERGQVMRKSNFVAARLGAYTKRGKGPRPEIPQLAPYRRRAVAEGGCSPENRVGPSRARLRRNHSGHLAWIPSLQAKAAEAMTGVFGRLRRLKKHLKAA